VTVRSLLRHLLVAVALTALTGCSTGRYVWADALREPRAPDEYVIAAGDVVGVRVFNQENMTTRARVRGDGKITVPLLGDVEVRGRTPEAAASDVAVRYRAYLSSPRVTVTVEEAQPTGVSVLGEVTRPGIYALERPAGVLQALAAAGGLTEFAGKSSIYVVRPAPAQRVRFSLSSLIEAGTRSATFRLRAGDVVVVE
jgi:polysaccharide export outer membrane protein